MNAALSIKSRNIGEPRPGFFKLRKVRGGPYVGARIVHGPPTDPLTGETLDRSWLWETWIDGALVRSPSPEPVKAGVFRVWYHGSEIPEAEYRYLIDDREWCRRNAPQSPEATPDQAVDLESMKPVF